jgi:hypothetical protein
MRTAGVVANLSVFLTFLVATVLYVNDESLFYLAVQEDGYLEWATFWGFVVAAGIFSVQAWRQFKVSRQLPWFVLGLAFFCFLVAMEEISWGQRLLGYKAPNYFLEQNYQQELNIHNVLDTGARKLMSQIILLGYGVILSAVSLWPPVRRIFVRLHVVAPPPMLIVSFLTMFVVYSWYPWSHTGEWVELTMSYGLVFIALFPGQSVTFDRTRSPTKKVLIVLATIWLLAVLTVFAVRYAHAVDPARVASARREIAALTADFDSGHLHTRCGIHKRLYTFMREYQQPYLLKGKFARLLRETGNGGRAEYLLDPWNSAYWIRHKCANGREVKFVYSFGPNRQRDATAWELKGEDIGAYLGSTR